jgi:hypothetical protein
VHVLLLVFPFVLTLGDPRRQEHPAALAAHPGRDIEQAKKYHRLRAQPGLLAQFLLGQRGRLDVSQVGRGALRKLPPPPPHRIAELLDEAKPVTISRATNA